MLNDDDFEDFASMSGFYDDDDLSSDYDDDEDFDDDFEDDDDSYESAFGDEYLGLEYFAMVK